MTFEEGIYRESDYWLIPARTAIGFEIGTVEWPRDGANPIPQTPAGTGHHFAPWRSSVAPGERFRWYRAPIAEGCSRH